MEPYHRAVDVLPFSEGLLAFDGTSPTVERALASLVTDDVALETRLMLQRKYFQNREMLHFRKVVSALKSSGKVNATNLAALNDGIAAMEEVELEIGAGNGELKRGAYQNTEDSMYGFLLHADMEKARRMALISDSGRILALRDYVLKREKLLLLIEKTIQGAGVSVVAQNT